MKSKELRRLIRIRKEINGFIGTAKNGNQNDIWITKSHTLRVIDKHIKRLEKLEAVK